MITNDIKELTNYVHKVHFYGNMPINDLKTLLNAKHISSPKKLKPAPKVKRINPIPTQANTVYFVHYDAKQSYCRQLTRGDIYNESQAPVIALYNQYFGGSMNSIVFQEMREKTFFSLPIIFKIYFLHALMDITKICLILQLKTIR